MTSIVPATVRDAVVLAEAGLPVFPCTLQKAPMTANGFKDATRQPDGDVYAYKDRGDGSIWYGRWPDGDTLLGVPTGAASGLVVIDVDTYKAAEWTSADPSRLWLEDREQLLNTGRIHRTGSGGYHYIFRLPRELVGHRQSDGPTARDYVAIKSRAGIRVGGQTLSYVDVRADGGYVIWWAAHGCDCSQPGDSMAGKRSLADAVAAIPVLPPELLADLLESCRETSVAPPTDAAKRDPMVAAFQERGLYRREKAPGLHCVTCPWIEEHPGGIQHADDTSVYFEAHFNGRGHAAYVCKDAACDGKRTLTAVRTMLGNGGSSVDRPVQTVDGAASEARGMATQEPATRTDAWLTRINDLVDSGRDPIAELADWPRHLIRGKSGAALSTPKNITLALGYSPETFGAFVYDEFRGCIMVSRNMRYLPQCSAPYEWVDDLHWMPVASWCNEHGMTQVSKGDICDAVRALADLHRTNSARVYFERLKWDGVPRLGTWLRKYAFADGGDEYLSRVGAWFLIGVVARACEPGTKQDYTLVFVMKQGVGKTTVAEALALKQDWFTDRVSALGSKDSLMELRGRLIVELAELEVFRKSEVEAQKAFLTSRVDKYRAPYGRSILAYPRTCSFIGTTNERAFLHDLTGNRRFWPVKCGDMIDVMGLRRDIDQMYAEAYEAWRAGERHWPTVDDNPIMEIEQEKYRIVSPLEEALTVAVNTDPPKDMITNDWLYTQLAVYGQQERGKISRQVAAVMRKLGYDQVRTSKERVWSRMTGDDR